ncbi:hypothetical protein [Ramlibacter ginsenosidimutans]
MIPARPRKAVSVAHEKTVVLRDDVRQAEASLHEANDALADTVVGSIVTKETVEAALVQNLQVEGQLHDAVKELEVVSDLLKVAEAEKAAHEQEDARRAGRHSGEGAESVLEHMKALAERKPSSD